MRDKIMIAVTTFIITAIGTITAVHIILMNDSPKVVLHKSSVHYIEYVRHGLTIKTYTFEANDSLFNAIKLGDTL